MMFAHTRTGRLGTISPRTSVRDAAATMAMVDRRALPVAENGRLLGVIAFSDMSRRAGTDGSKVWDLSVGDLMTTKVAIREEHCLEFNLESLARQGVEYILVLDTSGRPKALTFVDWHEPKSAESDNMEESEELPPRPASDDVFDELLELARTCRTPRQAFDAERRNV